MNLKLAAVSLTMSCMLPYSFGQAPTEVAQKGRTAIVMLESESWASGLVVGSDPGAIYIAGAAHMLSSCSPPFQPVTVTLDGVATNKVGTVKQCDSSAGVDTVLLTVPRDADTNAFLLRYDPNLLASTTPPRGSTVHSFGYSNFSPWFLGKDETLLPSSGDALQFRTDADAGQSGGGLFTEAWELIGTPLRIQANVVTARPIQQLLDLLNKWSVPVALKVRPQDQRMVGDQELARSRASDLLAEKANSARLSNDTPAAITYILEGRKFADTPKLQAEASVIPRPALELRYTSTPDDSKKGYTAIAGNEATHLLAVGGADGSLRLLNAADGKLVRSLPRLAVPIASLTFSNDGSLLAAGVHATDAHPNVGIAIWKTDGTAPASWMQAQNVFGGTVTGVQFLNATRMAGLVGNSGMLFLIDLTTGTELTPQRKTVAAAQSMQRLTEGEFLLSGIANHTLVTFANDSFSTETMPGCPAQVAPPIQRSNYGRVALTLSTPRVLARACDDTITLSDSSGNSEHQGGHHTAPISQIVTFDSHGAIISGGWDGKVRIWDAHSGNELGETGLHRGGIRQILPVNGGKAVAVLEQDADNYADGGSLRVWTYRPEDAFEDQATLKPPPGGLTRPPINPALFYGPTPRSSVTCWLSDGSTKQMSIANQPNARLASTPDCSFGATFTADHVRLFNASGDGTWAQIGENPGNGILRGMLARNADVAFWTEQTNTPGAPDPQTRAYIWAPPAAPVKLLDAPGAVVGAAISDDGKLVALSMFVGSEGPIRVWDWRANKLILSRGNPLGMPGDLVFAKDGSLFVSVGVGVELWTPKTSVKFSAGVNFTMISHLFLSPDGSTLAVTASIPGGTMPRHLFLFNVSQRKQMSEARLAGTPTELEFSLDSRQLSVDYLNRTQRFGVRKTDQPEMQQALTGDRLSEDNSLVPNP